MDLLAGLFSLKICVPWDSKGKGTLEEEKSARVLFTIQQMQNGDITM